MANFLTSSIGKKFIQSISGAFLIIFLILHGTINFFSVLDSMHGNFGKVAEDAVRFSEGDGWFQLGCDFMSTRLSTSWSRSWPSASSSTLFTDAGSAMRTSRSVVA